MNQAVNAGSDTHEIDTGLFALYGIATYYRVAADPRQLGHDLALIGKTAARKI